MNTYGVVEVDRDDAPDHNKDELGIDLDVLSLRVDVSSRPAGVARRWAARRP